ncbi:2-oxoacid ferredoxin oxidoreductase [Candidatus Woesearchaeota archaeon]|nr:MAG: 2-oxoacid ferredoxin oxidoreductase [Candidatus Woesearchaeota archaeon]
MTDIKEFEVEGLTDIAWCKGCGNFAILRILKKVFSELDIPPEKVVMTSGIGQAAKTPQYIEVSYFNGLHGRSIPVATAIKCSNPELTVIADSGDGCMYGEGGNHFIHAIRRNPDITVIVHNNMVYGLTKGQASPTSEKGMKTPVQVEGVILEPFNPISVAVALDASFVARAFSGHVKETAEIIKEAVKNKGLSIVDLFQPCITFNKINTYKWFNEHTYYLDESYDPYDRNAAFVKSVESEKLPLGIIYRSRKKTFEEQLPAYESTSEPIIHRQFKREEFERLVESIRRG